MYATEMAFLLGVHSPRNTRKHHADKKNDDNHDDKNNDDNHNEKNDDNHDDDDGIDDGDADDEFRTCHAKHIRFRRSSQLDPLTSDLPQHCQISKGSSRKLCCTPHSIINDGGSGF